MSKFLLKPDGERFLRTNPPLLEITYLSDGLDDINDVDWWAKFRVVPETWTLSNFGTLYLQGYEIKRMSHKIYEVYVTYGPKPVNAWSFQATTYGQTVKVKCGVHIRTYAVDSSSSAGSPSGADANLYQGAINPNPETGEIEGMDIIVGNVGSFDLLVPMAAGRCTLAYMKQTAQLVGMSNEQPLASNTFVKGELLYVGSDLPDGRYVPVIGTHHFLFSRDLQSAVVSGISGVTKEGFQVAWVEFQRLTANGRPVSKPIRVQIEQVYEHTTQFPSELGFPS